MHCRALFYSSVVGISEIRALLELEEVLAWPRERGFTAEQDVSASVLTAAGACP